MAQTNVSPPKRWTVNSFVFNNLLWFVASLILAILVWIFATNELDPISELEFPQEITINVVGLDDGLIVVDMRETVPVKVRAQQSVHEQLLEEDITVYADVTGLDPGEHFVELTAEASRRAVIDTQPRQIKIVLEEYQAQQVQIDLRVTREPPAGYEYSEVVFDISQVEVNGPASKVEQVIAARARLDLNDQRDPLETSVQLVPISANGNVVSGVVLNPQVANVSVRVTRRADVREIVVQPDTNNASLPAGYTVSAISYEPQTILVIGESSALDALPNTLFTERISLAGRTEDFVVTVPVVFPGRSFSVLGPQAITVSIDITVVETTVQFDNIPIDIIGVDQDSTLEVEIIPEQVTVLVSGAESALAELTADEISVLLDLKGLTRGTYNIEPEVSTGQGRVQSVLPDEITVIIKDPTAEQTPTPDSQAP